MSSADARLQGGRRAAAWRTSWSRCAALRRARAMAPSAVAPGMADLRAPPLPCPRPWACDRHRPPDSPAAYMARHRFPGCPTPRWRSARTAGHGTRAGPLGSAARYRAPALAPGRIPVRRRRRRRCRCSVAAHKARSAAWMPKTPWPLRHARRPHARRAEQPRLPLQPAVPGRPPGRRRAAERADGRARPAWSCRPSLAATRGSRRSCGPASRTSRRIAKSATSRSPLYAAARATARSPPASGPRGFQDAFLPYENLASSAWQVPEAEMARLAKGVNGRHRLVACPGGAGDPRRDGPPRAGPRPEAGDRLRRPASRRPIPSSA